MRESFGKAEPFGGSQRALASAAENTSMSIDSLDKGTAEFGGRALAALPHWCCIGSFWSLHTAVHQPLQSQLASCRERGAI